MSTVTTVATAGRSLAGLVRNRGAAPGGVVLAYHDVVASTAARGEFDVSATQLRRHIRLLRRLGFDIVGLGELVDRFLDGGSLDRLAAVTFDDGLVGVHGHGLAVLRDEDARATVFVVTDERGGDPPWWPGAQRTMADNELRQLVEAGLDLGVHTRSHLSLPSVPGPTLAAELADSRTALESLVDRPVDILAYPYGHHDARVRRAAAAAGFRAAFTYLNGRLTGSEDPFKLPRLTMGPNASRGRFGLRLGRSASSWPDHQIDVVDGTNM